MQDDPARAPSLGTRGKEHVIEPVREPGPSKSSLEVIPKDGLVRVLLRVDSPHRWTTPTWSLSNFGPNKEGEVHRYKLSTLKVRACSTMSRSGVVLSPTLEIYIGW